MKFKRKDTDVSALQFVDGQYGQAIDFCPTLIVNFEVVNGARTIKNAKLAGATVTDGSWLVKDGNAFTVMADETFRAQYEAA